MAWSGIIGVDFDLKNSFFWRFCTYDTGVSFIGSINIGLLKFGLTIQMNKVLDVIYCQLMSQL
jgi:hypothetical protein